MKKILYKTFSRRAHHENSSRRCPSVCQYELTFGCDYHCNYCFADCHNNAASTAKELCTEGVKAVLKEMGRAGVLWVCFTGGDPLTRGDFREIYSFAKRRGFIITIFTNGYRMDEEMAGFLKKNPPFAIEITLNAVTGALYERISQKRGSFEKAMRGIELAAGAGLPLKLKTQVTKDNLAEIEGIRSFAKKAGVPHGFSTRLFCRLNGDAHPCGLRISPAEILSLRGKAEKRPCPEDGRRNHSESLFRCQGGKGGGVNVDPYGKAFFCHLIREPSFRLLETGLGAALEAFSRHRNAEIAPDSKCRGCAVRDRCRICPGIAFLETGRMDAPVEYFCDLANAEAGRELL
ncbi:MAG: radical SAM protein [Pseudomonadota bacterium]